MRRHLEQRVGFGLSRSRLALGAQLIGGGVLAITLLMWGLSGSAAAQGPAEGSQVPGSAIPVGSFTPDTPFSSGQVIEVTIPANDVFTGQPRIEILECSDPQGLVANDPTSISDCDGNTVQGPTVNANTDGSVDYMSYTVYALPDSISLDEPSTNTPVCNLSNACVLYIGEDQNDFTQPHYFSQPFYVAPNSDDGGENPGDGSPPAAPTAPDPSTSTVSAQSLTPCPSDLSPAPPACAVADGSDSANITVTLLDANSVPVVGKTVSLTGSSGKTVITPQATGSNVTGSNGQAIFTVTDPSVEAVTYTAFDQTDSDTQIDQTTSVDFVAPTVSATNSSVVENPPQVASGGSSTITVTLRDQGGQNSAPVPGQAVTLSASGGSSTIDPSTAVTTDASGTATFTVSDSADEIVTYTAIDTTESPPLKLASMPSVTFGTLTVSASASTVKAASIAPTGHVGTSVIVTLLTSGGSPVAGKNVTLSLSASTPSSTVAISPSTAQPTGSDGTASFQVTDSAPETVSFNATDTDDQIAITQTAQVQFENPGAPSATASTVTCNTTSDGSCDSEPADGQTPAVVNVTLVDQFKTPVQGEDVTAQLTDTSGNARATPQLVGGTTLGETDAQGVVAFDVVDTTAEQVTFNASFSSPSGSSSGTTPTVLSQSVTLTFTPGTPDPNVSTIGANPTTVASDGKTASTITVTLEDHEGNVVPGKAVTLAASGGSSKIDPTTPVTTGSDGEATFTVTDATAESVTYTASDTTDTPNVVLTSTVTVTFGTPKALTPTVADSAMTASATTAPADGSTAVKITVTLADANGDPVTGKTVTLNPSGGSSVISPATTGTTDQDGIVTFSVTDKTPESVTYTATDTTDSLPLTGLSASVTFTATATLATGSSITTTTTTTTVPASQTSASSSGGTGTSESGSSSDTGATASDTSASAQLAYTGTPGMTRWLLVLGALLLLCGSFGRRRSLRKS